MDKKNYKVIAIAAGAVIIIGLAVVIGRSDLFQGRLGLIPKPIALVPGLYRSADVPPKVVSGVTSPVPSVVTSDVTSEVPSQVGPSVVVSEVTSQVPSVVVSGVTSAVPVDKKTAAKVADVSKLPLLSGDVLKSLAKEDMRKNPAKYVLSREMKKKIIDLYLTTNGGR